jgi:predicted dehydrogenase
MDKVRIGVIGTGAISNAYLGMAKNFRVVEIVACADINIDAAKSKAAEHGIPNVCTVEQLLADPSIEIVLNLTIPKAHAPVAIKTLEAGKHTYLEKPLGITRAEGDSIISLAKKKNLRVGCAPDTFMGAGIQTARKLLDDGAIGRPVAFTAFMLCKGHEHWHPNPQFYYEAGGGPMLDMGPYYITALLNLLGPVKRLSGFASTAITDRTITSKEKFGTKIRVETPDHITGQIEFQNGAVGTLMTSFATRFPTYDKQSPITIYGEKGTMKVPDPNTFDGPVFTQVDGQDDWQPAPHQFVAGYGRSIGLADMACALRSGRRHRACGHQALLALDLMQGFIDSSNSGKVHIPKFSYERPAPMPADLPFGTLDS